jgi:hypothetical protein
MRIDKVASVALLVLGAWLLLSMSAWAHSSLQLVNAAAVGAASFAMGLCSLAGNAAARRIAGALGIWLYVSTWLLPRGQTMDLAGAVVNNLVVALLLFGFSVLPAGDGRKPERRAA